MLPEIDAASVVLFAAASVVTALILCFAMRRNKRGDPAMKWLIASNLSLLAAASGMLTRPLIGFEASSILVIGGAYAGMCCAYFAVLRAEGERPRYALLVAIGVVSTAAQAALAIFAESATPLMLTSSAVNSVVTLLMTLGVWRRLRHYGSGTAILISLPFAAFFAGYFIRLILVLVWPESQAPLAATVMIITVMAWAAVILELGMIALREALAGALERLEAANVARSRFLLAISHELRTPLNAVLGLSELMRAESAGPLTEPYRTFVNHIHDNGRSLLGLVTDLLDIAAVENHALALEEAELDPTAIASETVESFAEAAEAAGVALTLKVARDAPRRMRADPVRLARAASNLIDNAVRFVGQGGTVEVEVSAAADGSMAIIVTDDGPGMPDAELARALELFGRVKGVEDPNEGVGVGLPLAREIVKAHGGRLEMTSAPGEGVTATAFLPASRILEDRLRAGDQTGEQALESLAAE